MTREEGHELLKMALILLLFILAMVAASQRDGLQQEAVDRGFAEWRIIEGTRRVEFAWKESIKTSNTNTPNTP